MESSAESGTGASGPHRGERDGNRTLRRRRVTPESGARVDTIPHQTRPPRPAMPTSVRIRPAQSADDVVNVSFTCFAVGFTTMKFGVARHGPSAPATFQFG